MSVRSFIVAATLAAFLGGCSNFECIFEQCTKEGTYEFNRLSGDMSNVEIRELAKDAVGSAGPPQTAAVLTTPREAILKYLDSVSSRDVSQVRMAVWSNACRFNGSGGRSDCYPLAEVPFGRPGFGVKYKINDMRLWHSKDQAVASVHHTSFADDVEGKNTGERSVCLTQIEASLRDGEWRVASLTNIYCNSYASWNGRPL